MKKIPRLFCSRELSWLRAPCLGLFMVASPVWAVAPKVPTPAPPLSFQPTPAEWLTLKILAVSQMTFRAERLTEGKITLNDEAVTPVFSPFSGRVTQLMAKIGDVVKPGAPLARVQSTELSQAQNDLVVAATARTTARAQMKLAELTEKRQSGLYAAQGTPLKTWLQSQTDLLSARQVAQASEMTFTAAHNHLLILGRREKDIQALLHAPVLEQADAQALLNAPIGGTIIQRQIGLGQNIEAGASAPVFTIANLSTVWLVANMREGDAPLVQVGAPVRVHLLAMPDRVFAARLSYVSATLDPLTHRLPVRAQLANPDGILRPEMFATFSVTTEHDREALAVPEGAVVYEGDEAHVWLAQGDKTLVLRKIRIGRSDGAMVEVEEGLSKGDEVVTSGALFIDRAAISD